MADNVSSEPEQMATTEVQPQPLPETDNVTSQEEGDATETAPEEGAITIAAVPNLEPAEEVNLEAAISASSDAIKFLSTIDPAIWRYISYTDQLAILTQKPRELEAGLTSVGNYNVSVEPLWYMDCDCFKISAEMKYQLPDVSIQYNLSTYVTPLLRTLHESKVLVCRTKQQVIERKTEIISSSDGADMANFASKFDLTYSAGMTSPQEYTSGQYSPEVTKHQLEVPVGFLSEGALIMLDRIITRRLANRTFSWDLLNKLNFVVITPTTDGTDDIIKPPQTGPPLPAFLALLAPPKVNAKKFVSLANLAYGALPPRQMTVKENEEGTMQATFELMGFERLIQPPQPKVLPIVSFSYHLQDGHLAVQIQAGCPVQLQITQAPLVVPEDEFLQTPVVPRQDLDWENDMQLRAVFDERTEELKNEFFSFIRHKPEMRALLADFLQALLLRKPDNVIAFASQYFSAFGSVRPLSSEVANG